VQRADRWNVAGPAPWSVHRRLLEVADVEQVINCRGRPVVDLEGVEQPDVDGSHEEADQHRVRGQAETHG
jgi:hypothetical protein